MIQLHHDYINEESPMKRKLKILIVDDNEALLSTSKLMFAALGHNPVAANDARQALDILSEESNIDLIFTDLGLPYINGWEFIRMARSHGFNNPVIVVSGVSNAPSEPMMAQLNIHKKIGKPFKLNDLREVLESVEKTLAP
ncbi:MAG: hypothetical protein CO189_10915 [candidate division Zixibacteria bacterium CG_4_9_14_3_um_filter_46_8]|nr:MAG: hypothetical protein CO189_10915 [candidate division Zixibacteria bacterium CG_4_9_14_3_um_filter_46_8]